MDTVVTLDSYCIQFSFEEGALWIEKQYKTKNQNPHISIRKTLNHTEAHSINNPMLSLFRAMLVGIGKAHFFLLFFNPLSGNRIKSFNQEFIL